MSIYKLPSLTADKYNSVQIFRFIAALMVIIMHSTFYTSERLSPGMPLYYAGANGIRLFFVISGFVMIISSKKLVTQAGGWKIFFIKRIVRIVPIYWIVTTYKLVALVFAASLVYQAKVDIGYIIKSYFFIPALNNQHEFNPVLGVGWTLNLEMFFTFYLQSPSLFASRRFYFLQLFSSR